MLGIAVAPNSHRVEERDEQRSPIIRRDFNVRVMSSEQQVPTSLHSISDLTQSVTRGGARSRPKRTHKSWMTTTPPFSPPDPLCRQLPHPPTPLAFLPAAGTSSHFSPLPASSWHIVGALLPGALYEPGYAVDVLSVGSCCYPPPVCPALSVA
jgi:hypothetical protein